MVVEVSLPYPWQVEPILPQSFRTLRLSYKALSDVSSSAADAVISQEDHQRQGLILLVRHAPPLEHSDRATSRLVSIESRLARSGDGDTA